MRHSSSSAAPRVAREREISANEELALAIRRIVREEVGKPPEKTEPQNRSAPHETVGIFLLILNVVLLYTCLPRSVVNKDLIDFIAKVATLAGGGLALLNPSSFRRFLTRSVSRPAFLPVNVAILILLAGVQLGRVPVRVDADPPSAVVIVDDSERHASGERIWLSLADHKLKLHPGEGDLYVGETKTKIEDREIAIGWPRVLAHLWPWAARLHFGMLSKVFVTFDEGGRYRLTLRPAPQPFDLEFRHSTTELKFEGPFAGYRDTPGELDQDTFTIPFGRYVVDIEGKLPDGRTCRAAGREFVVDKHTNAFEPGKLDCVK